MSRAMRRAIQLVYFLPVVFFSSFLFFHWLSVFTAPLESTAPIPTKLGVTLGVTPGDSELALYLASFLTIASTIPLLVGLSAYSKTGSKKGFLLVTSGLMFIAADVALLLLKCTAAYFLRSVWNDFFDATLAISPILLLQLLVFLIFVYGLAISLYHMRVWLKVVMILVLAVLSCLSFAFSWEVYVTFGDCRGYTDAYCLGRVAASQRDPSMCDKMKLDETFEDFQGRTLEERKKYCIHTYIDESRDFGPCLNMTDTVVTRESVRYLSERASCIVDHYANRRDMTGTDTFDACNLIENQAERDYCKKYKECTLIRLRTPNSEWTQAQYHELNSEIEQCETVLRELGIDRLQQP